VIAMCGLGLDPLTPGVPPKHLRDHLLSLARHYGAQVGDPLVYDLALAFGCGWQRLLLQGVNGWDQVWPPANKKLALRLLRCVSHCNQWLAHNNVVGFEPRADDEQFFDSLKLAAALELPEKPVLFAPTDKLTIVRRSDGTRSDETVISISGSFWREIRAGSRMVWSVADGDPILAIRPGWQNQANQQLASGWRIVIFHGDQKTRVTAYGPGGHPFWQLDDHEEAVVTCDTQWTMSAWDCACGTTPCMEQHRLQGWNPAARDLAARDLGNFLANAVNGPNVPLKAGGFVQGMYGAMLSRGDDPGDDL